MRVTRAVIDTQTVRLPGNVLPAATVANDRGPAPGNLPMQSMLLVLRRSPQQELALEQQLSAQREAGSPEYHHWLTPQQFGERFGPAPEDVAAVTAWLRRSGFTINRVATGRGVIEFSGDATQVATALHAPIHRFRIGGALHWANAVSPAIPAALQSVIAGVVSLNDVRKPAGHAIGHGHASALGPDALVPQLNFVTNTGVTGHALAPADFAVIYDLDPAYTQDLNGSGETIAIVARSDVNSGDVQAFRQLFFPAPASSNLPQTIVAGNDPGDPNNDDTGEATLDVEWSGAVAPMAKIDLVVAASTNTTDGVDLAAQYIVDNDLAPVMSTSFGQCEAHLGVAENAFWSALYEQAAAEGISAFVSSGDNGPAGCDDQTKSTAVNGLAVSGLASTPFATAVGGTEFTEGGGSYWSSLTQPSQFYESALSYIAERPWNESAPQPGGQGLWSGSGGVSTIYAKPGWQSGNGVPQDGKRDVPDVALAAAGHDGYVVCLESSCSGAPDNWEFFIFAGTSAASPSMAGVMALVDQKLGGPQGLADPYLYQLAAQQNAASPGACAASGPPAASCTLLDVTSGNNIIPCTTGTADCTSGSFGYDAAPGYDLATGLGSVNASNLIRNWSNVKFVASTVTLTAPASFTYGQSLPVSIQVAAASGSGSSATPTGDVELLMESGTTITPVQLEKLSGGAISLDTSAFPAGTYSLVARYAGDLTFGAGLSTPVSVTVAKAATTLQLNLFEKNATGGQIPLTPGGTVAYGAAVYATVSVATASGTPASGSVLLANNVSYPATNYAQNLPLSGGTATTPAPVALNGGGDTYTASFGGDANDLAAAPTSVGFTVAKATTSLTIADTNPAAGTITATLQTSAAVGVFSPVLISVLSSNGTLVASILAFNSSTDPNTGDLDFSGTGNLFNLPAGAAAVLTATFAGDANYQGSSAPAITVPTPPTLTVTPAQLTFPTIVMGSSSTAQAITVSNVGGSTLTNFAVHLSDPDFTETDNCSASFAAGSSCIVQVTFSPNGPGTPSAIMWMQGSQVQAQITGTASGFTLLPSTWDPSVAIGQAVSIPLTLSPIGGFTGPVTFSCSNLPLYATCSYAPASATLDGKTPVSVTLTISTLGPKSGGSGPAGWPTSGSWWLGLGMALGLWLFGLRDRSPSGARRWRLAAVTLAAAATLACGGGGGGGNGGVVVPPPPGNGGPGPPAPYQTNVLQISTFGSVMVGASATESFPITNGGEPWPAPALTITESGFTKPDFSATDSCTGTMAAGEICTIQVIFAPTVQKSETGQLALDSGKWVAPMALWGTGTAPQTPAGNYQVNLIGTSGTASIAAQLYLNVH